MEKTSEEDQRNSTVCVRVPKVIDARDEIQMAHESQESPQTPAVLMSESCPLHNKETGGLLTKALCAAPPG